MNSILSWSAWIPLARMSYAIYLVKFPSILHVITLLLIQVHLTVMQVVSSYDSYRVKVTHVSNFDIDVWSHFNRSSSSTISYLSSASALPSLMPSSCSLR